MTRQDRKAARGRAAYRRGQAAERLAGWALRLKGYRILARRWRTPHGEIDLIALKGGTLAFVEVKARAGTSDSLEAVTAPSQRRIAQAAEAYLRAHPRLQGLTRRFDVVTVAPHGWPVHIRDAFGE